MTITNSDVLLIKKARPFLKWAGGKSQLLPELRKHIPAKFKTYYEPFVGAGAFFFDLAPKTAVLGDTNEALIDLYKTLRLEHPLLVRILLDLADKYNADPSTYYYVARRKFIESKSSEEKAALFLFLNKTCFNGLYRVNKSGDFNTSWGKRAEFTVDVKNLLACHAALKDAQIVYSDFTQSVDPARNGDLVYFDPPYVPLTKTANFTGFTKERFNHDDQILLRDTALRLKKRGVHVILSNSDTAITRELYAGFAIHPVRSSRAINSVGTSRGSVGELIIT